MEVFRRIGNNVLIFDENKCAVLSVLRKKVIIFDDRLNIPLRYSILP